MNILFQAIDRSIISDDFLNKIFDFGDILRSERDPDEPHPDRELRKGLFFNLDPTREMYEWAILDENKVVGYIELGWENETSPSFNENRSYSGVSVELLPEYRSKGLGTKALSIAINKLKEEKPETKMILANVSHESGKAFVEKYGGKVALEGAENRLYTRDIDWDMIKEWIKEGREIADSENITLKQFKNHCPEEIIDEYVSVYGEIMNQQPMGDFDGKIGVTVETYKGQSERIFKQGITRYTMYTEESDGNISGLTEILYSTVIPHKAMQQLTGVKEEYRGRKLGKWLKAEMLNFIVNQYPHIKYITTGNASSNAPMLSINTRMGFKTFETYIMYMIPFENILEKL